MEHKLMQSFSSAMDAYYHIIWPAGETAIAPNLSLNAQPGPAEAGDSATPAVTASTAAASASAATHCISKPESKKMLKELWRCEELSAARKLVGPILKRYVHLDKGLYPLGAAKAISRIQGGFSDAWFIFFLVTVTTINQAGDKQDATWKSLRKGAGAASRTFKTLDSTFSLIVALHWLSVVRRGAEIEWDPLPIVDWITVFWKHLLDRIPPPAVKPTESKHGMPHLLHREEPQILKLCRHVLLHVQQRRIAVIKARKVAGPLLPKELVGMIADAMCDSAPSLKILRKLKSPEFEDFVPYGMDTVKTFARNEDPAHDTECKEMHHLCFMLQRDKKRNSIQDEYYLMKFGADTTAMYVMARNLLV